MEWIDAWIESWLVRARGRFPAFSVTLVVSDDEESESKVAIQSGSLSTSSSTFRFFFFPFFVDSSFFNFLEPMVDGGSASEWMKKVLRSSCSLGRLVRGRSCPSRFSGCFRLVVPSRKAWLSKSVVRKKYSVRIATLPRGRKPSANRHISPNTPHTPFSEHLGAEHLLPDCRA